MVVEHHQLSHDKVLRELIGIRVQVARVIVDHNLVDRNHPILLVERNRADPGQMDRNQADCIQAQVDQFPAGGTQVDL